jgi:predicted phosphodiesterase
VPAWRRAFAEPRSRRAARVLAAALVALVAAGAAMATVGGTDRQIGPVDVRVALVPSLSGGTTVSVPPLGRLVMDTHDGPLRLSATVDGIRLDAARGLVSGGTTTAALRERLTSDVRAALVAVAGRSAAVALVAGGLAALLVLRRPRDGVVGVVAAAVVLAASGGAAVGTARASALTEPTYTGLLAQAPALIGSARVTATRFDQYSRQVAALTANVTQLYGALSTLPVDGVGSDSEDIRLLFVADIHNNPETFRVLPSLVEQFAVSAVVDVGDISDQGTAAENRLYDPVGRLPVPYVYVRGNHDSAGTQAHLASYGNVVVLDQGAVRDVAGVRFTGTGDPQFTPGPEVSLDEEGAEELTEQAGRTVAAAADRAEREGRPVDVALVHRPSMAGPLFGRVPLVLDGHVHRRRSRVDDGTLELTQGSSGGAGVRTLLGGQAQPLAMSVLHLDRETRRLIAVDDITIGGLGQRSVTVERHAARSYLDGEVPDAEVGDQPEPSPAELPTEVPTTGLPTTGLPTTGSPTAGLPTAELDLPAARPSAESATATAPAP